MRIIWSPLARDDLATINGWLTREASPAVALRMLIAIRDRARFLENFPRSGRPHRHGHRILRIFDTPYLLRYRIRDERSQ
ncbi:MAG: type II toxin-antitoxin system RelE/ParE family toxin [Sphingomonas sp.]|nr:MAG: type II toxin-antitoxin system RelE/ParE family toxin [Sphingomonas sp.]